MQEIQIRCFGSFRIERNGKSLDRFDTDKARALFIYLVVENSRPHRRSHLASLLWSDQSDQQALHSLRQSLVSIRKTFGPVLEDGFQVLVGDRDTIQLNPSLPIWVDALAFRQEMKAAFRYSKRGRFEENINIRRMQAALKIFSGRFLDQFDLRSGCLFDEWQLLTREEFDQSAAEAFAILADVQERKGDFRLACQAAQQVVSITPWDETAHARLIRLYALDQRPGAAQNQFRQMVSQLADQLGIEPSRETSQLIESIRTNSGLLRSPEIPPSHIPPFPTEFIGRDHDLMSLADHLADPHCKLLTLFGPGGVGKTRLAAEAARDQLGLFCDGVFFIPLSTATTFEQAIYEILHVFGLSASEQEDMSSLLVGFLRNQHLLLALDNIEQLLDDPQMIQLLEDILAHAGRVKVMATSRKRVNLQEEWVYIVEGMHVPELDVVLVDENQRGISQQTLEQYDALSLFSQRARQLSHRFTLDQQSLPNVIQICKLLEGMPLGVELAAAAVWEYPTETILKNITESLTSLTTFASNSIPRHRSLWAACEASWIMLHPQEKLSLARLSVFQGGFQADAASQVTGATRDTLTALVNQSLLRYIAVTDRYEFHEVIRQFALGQLNGLGESDVINASHARYYQGLVEQLTQNNVRQQYTQIFPIVEAELGNLKAAWEWLVESHQIDGMIACLHLLHAYFDTRSRFREGIALFTSAKNVLQDLLESHPSMDSKKAFSLILARIGSLAYYARENQLALASLETAQDYFLELGDSAELAFCRSTLGAVYLRAKDFSLAETCGQENLAYFQHVTDLHGQARSLYLLGLIRSRLGKRIEAKELMVAAVETARRLGDEKRLLMAPLNVLGDIACSEGDYPLAERCFQESLSISRELGNQYYQAIIINNLAEVYYQDGRLERARECYAESLKICRKIGDLDGEAVALNNLGEVAIAQGDFQAAVNYSEQALKIARQIGEEWTIVVCLNILAEGWIGVGQVERGRPLLTEALRLGWDIQALDLVVKVGVNLGRCFQLQNMPDKASALFRAVIAHSSTDFDIRLKAADWLNEVGGEQEQVCDDHMLEQQVQSLIS
jgi:predicted ATPase/DNA-binding SARP family transcriptional activator